MRTLPPISSPANPTVKATARLRDAAVRRQTGRILIDGQHEIAVASASGIRLQRLFVPAEQLAAAEAVVRSWAGSELLEIQPLLGRAMERVAYGQRGNGWVAVAEQPRVR
ncbi:MAG: hypothetical protein D6753_09435, partial [Planctomycetota bacterium]